jgi:hypothetical protein
MVIKSDAQMGIIGEPKNKSICSKTPNYDHKLLKIEMSAIKRYYH